MALEKRATLRIFYPCTKPVLGHLVRTEELLSEQANYIEHSPPLQGHEHFLLCYRLALAERPGVRSVFFVFCFLFFCCLGLHLRYMEVLRLGVESELRPTPQPQQHEILNPLSEARDRTCNFVVSCLVRFP